jgi:hypothetical protein
MVFAELFATRCVFFVSIKSWRMKITGKNLLPDLHIDPIRRDLIVVIATGLLIALGVTTLVVLIAGQL